MGSWPVIDSHPLPLPHASLPNCTPTNPWRTARPRTFLHSPVHYPRSAAATRSENTSKTKSSGTEKQLLKRLWDNIYQFCNHVFCLMRGKWLNSKHMYIVLCMFGLVCVCIWCRLAEQVGCIYCTVCLCLLLLIYLCSSSRLEAFTVITSHSGLFCQCHQCVSLYKLIKSNFTNVTTIKHVSKMCTCYSVERFRKHLVWFRPVWRLCCKHSLWCICSLRSGSLQD